MQNFCKTRKFPTYAETRGMKGNNDTDEYFVYILKKEDVGKYLNIWFEGKKIKASDIKNFKVKTRTSEIEDFIITDEIWTVKKTDKETSNHLYNRKINPIRISIMYLPKKGKDFDGRYDMKVQIHSIDDSSFGIWFMGKPLEELEKNRLKIMEWMNAYDEINGEEMFGVCIDLGADEDSKDYN